jgi:predicted transglutaminase-like cysteine proteinase
MSDWDHWGVADRWDYPSDGKGDREDYALWKRRLLIDLGFPRQAFADDRGERRT